jgi:hypothetical protein
MAEAASNSCASGFSIGLRPRGGSVEIKNGLLARKPDDQGTLGWKEAKRSEEGVPEGFALGSLSASGFFFARESRFWPKKASCGSGGTVLYAADAGFRARFLHIRCETIGIRRFQRKRVKHFPASGKSSLSTGSHKSVPPLTGGAREDRLRVGGETNAWSQAHSSN